MPKVWLLWYDNMVDDPHLVSVHSSEASAIKGAQAWHDLHQHGNWGNELWAEEVDVL